MFTALVFIFVTKMLSADEAQPAHPHLLREVKIVSSFDGTKQPALFFAPPKEAAPLLVSLHSWSGDYRQTATVPLSRWCVANDWAFVQPNFRGPNVGPSACASSAAIADVRDAVTFALGQAKVDTSRIYLVGSSGGGHMALMMAARHPDIWSGVSAWVPISDLAAWHAECKQSGRKYAVEMEAICGGAPGHSSESDQQYRVRSPLTFLENAKHVLLDIHAGIHDGHEGSVPVSHSLRAFNRVAESKHRISAEDIQQIVITARIPPHLREDIPHENAYGAKQPLFRRRSGRTRVTLFKGGHEMIPSVAIEWLRDQRRPEPLP